MNLGEKIFKLRKERGLSQEILADKLGTTRQAISKWENNQGFPDTERLLMLSNIFQVSIDYILKDSDETQLSDNNERGYYASREIINGYLANERRSGKFVGLWISTLIATTIPYLYLHKWSILTIMLTVVVAVSAISFFIIILLMDNKEYKPITREILIIDQKVIQEIKEQYVRNKPIVTILLTFGLAAMLVNFIPFIIVHKGIISYEIFTQFKALCVLFGSLGVFLYIYALSILHSYEVIVNNSKYINKLGSKLCRKIKYKIDNLLS